MSGPECGAWLYFKLFFSKHDDQTPDYLRSENAAECFLSDYALPALAAMRMENLCEKFFFIRYAEEGYHLRLRCFCRDNSSRQDARRRIHEVIDNFLAEHPEMIADASDAAGLVNDGRLVEDRYEPELDKYCGAQGMLVAEDHFEQCSRLVADVMSLVAVGLKKDHIALWLLGQALPAAGFSACESAAVLSGHSRYWWYAFGRDPESVQIILERNYCEKKQYFMRFLPDADLMTDYARAYPLVENHLGTVRDLYRETTNRLRILEGSGMLTSSVSHELYADSAADAMPSISRFPLTFLLILPNLIHMMNNRLGIDVVKESQLAYFAGRFFQERCDGPATEFKIALEPSLRLRQHATTVV